MDGMCACVYASNFPAGLWIPMENTYKANFLERKK